MGKAAEAADALAQAFFRAVPQTKSKRMSEEAWRQALEKFQTEAKQIRLRLSLGFLARAKAAYLLQQKLIAAGIHADTVRKVIFSLVVGSFISRK